MTFMMIHEDMPVFPFCLWFLFSLLDERCDVNHDNDEEEAHENRATDEECDMTLAVRWLCSSYVAWHCYKSDK